jgi:hypothetical protein
LLCSILIKVTNISTMLLSIVCLLWNPT